MTSKFSFSDYISKVKEIVANHYLVVISNEMRLAERTDSFHFLPRDVRFYSEQVPEKFLDGSQNFKLVQQQERALKKGGSRRINKLKEREERAT